MAEETKKTKRYWYFDLINVIACFCVVVMHCTSRVNNINSGTGWNLSIFLQAICIWAVTGFFMMSGANLLEYRQKYTTGEFLKKRVLRIVIPFLVWSLIYAIWKDATGQIEIISLAEGIRMFFKNQFNTIFWFFYTLIPAYFCIPVLSLVATDKNRKLAWYLFIIGLCNLSIFPLIQFLFHVDLSLVRFPIGYSPICLLILGWLLKGENISPKIRKLIYVGAILSVIILYFGTCHLSIKNNVFDKTIMTSGSIFAICIATALFLFLKHRNWKFVNSKWFQKTLRCLSSASLGVYFIQIIIMFYIKKLDFVDPYSIYWSVFGAIVVYIVCVIIVSIMKKIPVIKWLCP